MSAKENSIWGVTKRVLLVVEFTTLDRLLAFRTALKESGLNVNDSHILCVVSNKNERKVLRDVFSVSFVHNSDFNFLGRLKDENTIKFLKRHYDLLIVIGNYKGRMLKMIKKVNRITGVGVNSNVEFLTINMNTENTEPQQLLTFVRQTLSKIEQ